MAVSVHTQIRSSLCGGGPLLCYVSDWKAVKAHKAHKVSATDEGGVRCQIEEMVRKSRILRATTEVIHCSTHFEGMLRPTETAQFRSASLLKILLSIKAIPGQANCSHSGPAGSRRAPAKSANESATVTGPRGPTQADQEEAEWLAIIRPCHDIATKTNISLRHHGPVSSVLVSFHVY